MMLPFVPSTVPEIVAVGVEGASGKRSRLPPGEFACCPRAGTIKTHNRMASAGTIAIAAQEEVRRNPEWKAKPDLYRRKSSPRTRNTTRPPCLYKWLARSREER